eukprot:GHRR01022636.1.p1 GENE.GHRR01022636.1~~GHRR01022636.1.p1  ORF type:complete len:170 (+),score=34.21 GHRR01022636.1:658-1167(+)
MWSVKLRHLLPINQQRAVVCVAKARRMANSKYEYTKEFELDDSLLPSCWIVIRIDGKAFTKFSAAHKFEKPNDKRALDLMDECAKCVMQEFSEIKLAFGESDEYSFVLHKDTQLYGECWFVHQLYSYKGLAASDSSSCKFLQSCITNTTWQQHGQEHCIVALACELHEC